MSIFAQPTPAPKPRTKDVIPISFLYAGLLLVMVLAQLFTFEGFLELIATYHLPFSGGTTYFVGGFLVAAQVLALPYLLRMPLSKAFRWVSMVLGWIVAVLWLFMTSWILGSQSAVDSVGFLGTLAELQPGWWAVFASFALVILAAWNAWGLWPGKRKN